MKVISYILVLFSKPVRALRIIFSKLHLYRTGHTPGEEHWLLPDPDIRTVCSSRHTVLGQLLAEHWRGSGPNFLGPPDGTNYDDTELGRRARADGCVLCEGHGRVDLRLSVLCVRRTPGVCLGECFQPSGKSAEIGAGFTVSCQRKLQGNTLNQKVMCIRLWKPTESLKHWLAVAHHGYSLFSINQ